MPRMKDRVCEYIRTCDVCQKNKADHHLPRGFLENLDIPEQRWQSLSMDWVSLPAVEWDGHVYDEVLTVTDRANKMVHLIPVMKTSTAKDTATEFYEQIVRYHGLPRSIVSDRDTAFTSRFWKALCHRFDIRQRMSSPFYPQTNGQAERTNQTMKQVLRTLAAERGTLDWRACLIAAEI